MTRTRTFEPKVIVETRKLQGLRSNDSRLPDRKPMGRAFSGSRQAAPVVVQVRKAS